MALIEKHPMRTPLKEMMAIRRHAARWVKSGKYRLKQGTQFSRVATIARGSAWKTLREIEADIQYFFPDTPDTQAAISARLREVSPCKHGLVKQRTYYTSERGTIVHVYRLVPVTWLEEKAEREAA
ncbi:MULTISPECIES: hypothetical protein [unclassified Salinivibrio]|jgi:hypothetical protein|uniref:hypothetical protein n=1 Tax=unclassified Salinivibrio TaxID=2636825 RepID=UPI000696B0F8|nr:MULTISPECIES: hypothetical protein [unclassified Salinivibrio]MPX91400.1 hypothetical protein [Salinivibrio sp. VYel1]